MLYTGIELPLPEGAKAAGKDNAYVYLKLGPSSRDGSGKLKHNMILIGRVAARPGFFHPNENWYARTGAAPPADARAVGRGRRPKERELVTHGDGSGDAPVVHGFAAACWHVARETSLLRCLEAAFGVRGARRVMAVASCFVRHQAASVELLDVFCLKNRYFAEEVLTSRDAYEMFSNVREEDVDLFLRLWNDCHPSADNIFYDLAVPSAGMSDCRGDHETLEPIRFDLFLSRTDGLPLLYRHRWGCAGEFGNFADALSLARGHGLDGRLTVFAGDEDAARLRTFKGHDIIVEMPFWRSAAVRGSLLEWRNMATEVDDVLDDLSALGFASHEAPWSVDGVGGRLVMYCGRHAENLERAGIYNDIFYARKKVKDRIPASGEALPAALRRWCRAESGAVPNGGQCPPPFDEGSIREAMDLCGCFALFTTDRAASHQRFLEIHLEKAACGRFFSGVEHDVVGGSVLAHSGALLADKMFFVFVALIVGMALRRRLAPVVRSSRSSLEHCFELLDLMRGTASGGRWRPLGAMTRTQREMAEALGLPVAG